MKIIIDMPNRKMKEAVEKKINDEFNPWEEIDKQLSESEETEEEFAKRVVGPLYKKPLIDQKEKNNGE